MSQPTVADDNVSVDVSAVAYYRVVDAVKAGYWVLSAVWSRHIVAAIPAVKVAARMTMLPMGRVLTGFLTEPTRIGTMDHGNQGAQPVCPTTLPSRSMPRARMQVVAAFESATGRTLRVRHVPDAAMSVGHRALARIKPEIASLMGMALYSDTQPGTWDDQPLREIGITPRSATAFIQEEAASLMR